MVSYIYVFKLHQINQWYKSITWYAKQNQISWENKTHFISVHFPPKHQRSHCKHCTIGRLQIWQYKVWKAPHNHQNFRSGWLGSHKFWHQSCLCTPGWFGSQEPWHQSCLCTPGWFGSQKPWHQSCVYTLWSLHTSSYSPGRAPPDP